MSSNNESRPRRTRKTKTVDVVAPNKPVIESKLRRTRKTKTAKAVVSNKSPTIKRSLTVRKSSRDTIQPTTSTNKKKRPTVKNISCSCASNPCTCENSLESKKANEMFETPKPTTKMAKRQKKKKMDFEHLKPEWMIKEPDSSKCCDTDPCSCKIFPKFAKLKKMYTPCRVERSSRRSKTDLEPTPSTSSAADSPKKEYVISPKVMNYFMNAYKQSPQYADLKNKRFNTGFRRPRSTSCASPNFQLFTPEEEEEFERMQSEHLPEIRNEIRGVPGEKYANVFMSIPSLESVVLDDDEIPKEMPKGKKRNNMSKKGAKKVKQDKSFGYHGVPFEDKYLRITYPKSFVTNTVSLGIDMKGKQSIILTKEILEKCKK